MWIVWTLAAIVAMVVLCDLTQRRHAILRNFPVIGHFRYGLEAIGPELRQYIVTDNDEERPFSRDQRRWVYASAKKENNYFGCVATQNRWLMRGLDRTSKAVRLANYVAVMRKELAQLARACGREHPAEVGLGRFEVLDDRLGRRPASEVFGYSPATIPASVPASSARGNSSHSRPS